LKLMWIKASSLMRKQYLTAFNIIAALGWSAILLRLIQEFIQGASPIKVWNSLGFTVIVVQTLAFLEIIHSLLRFVSSPLLPTVMQVSSRLFLVWVITSQSLLAQQHYSLYFMLFSWSLIEIPRYLFYAFNLFPPGPYILFWLRYSLFVILYPTGIYGELGQIWNTMKGVEGTFYWNFLAFVLVIYIPASPYLYYHMIVQRRRAFEKLDEPQKEN